MSHWAPSSTNFTPYIFKFGVLWIICGNPKGEQILRSVIPVVLSKLRSS